MYVAVQCFKTTVTFSPPQNGDHISIFETNYLELVLDDIYSNAGVETLAKGYHGFCLAARAIFCLSSLSLREYRSWRVSFFAAGSSTAPPVTASSMGINRLAMAINRHIS